ncbi:phage head-tail joining protein [Arvimicrobium flavum]|uniref:phage head-tail joining protein n=1 Tax=Arvimicrobium flavum TaxID=3393320 RepID=UPI00237B82F8|nr:hypothetical protein [Mesorhizobium shangrilense]
MTLEQLQLRIDKLEAAIATGARRVTFRSGGTEETVEYHSLADMRVALSYLKSLLPDAPGRRTVAAFRNGA